MDMGSKSGDELGVRSQRMTRMPKYCGCGMPLRVPTELVMRTKGRMLDVDLLLSFIELCSIFAKFLHGEGEGFDKLPNKSICREHNQTNIQPHMRPPGHMLNSNLQKRNEHRGSNAIIKHMLRTFACAIAIWHKELSCKIGRPA